MKHYLRYLFTLLFAALCTTNVMADEVTFTAGTDNGTGSTTASSFVVEKGVVKIAVSNGMASNNHYRIYKGQTLTVSVTGGTIQKIVMPCTASGTTKNGPGCFTANTGTYSYSGSTGTWEGDAASVVFTASTAQVRPTTITVTYTSTATQADPSSSWSSGAQFNTTVGGTVTAKFTTTSNGAITYAIEDESICSYDSENQTVTGLAVGKTHITAYVAETDTYLADTVKALVVVKDATKEDATVTWDPTSVSVATGETATAKATTTSDSEITYTVADTGIATYDSSTGTITPVAVGTTTITASVPETDTYNSASAELTVTVTKGVSTVTVKLQSNYEEAFTTGFGEFTSDEATANGTKVWSYSSTYGAKATAYVSNTNYAAESYLTSPYIVLSKETVDGTEPSAAKLTFSHAGKYFSDVTTMKSQIGVEVSEDGTNWSALDIDNWCDNSSWDYYDATIDLTQYLGKTIQLRLKYTSTATKAGTWEVKNLVVSESGLKNPTISWATDVDSVQIADIANYVLPELTVDPSTLTYTISSTDDNVAYYDTDDEAFYVLTTGTVTITATTTATDEYASASASFKLVVYDPAAPAKKYYKKVTSIESGKNYIIAAVSGTTAYAAYPLASSKTYGYLNASAVTIEDDIIGISTNYNDEWTFTQSDDGWTILGSDGRYLYQTGTYTSFNVSDAPTAGQYWTVEIDEDGVATITNSSVSKYIQYYSAKSSYGSYDTETGIKPTLWEELETIDVEVGETGYATMYYGDKALILSNKQLTATTYSLSNGNLSESTVYADGDIIPAGEGVVLNGAQGTYTFYVVTSSKEKDANNALLGSDEDAQTVAADGTTDGYKFYMLSTKDGADVGFYWGADEGAAFTNGAHRAYLAVKQSAAAKFYLLNGQTTGIDAVETSESVNDGKIFDLSGRQVTNPQRGIYIKNGKKYIVK